MTHDVFPFPAIIGQEPLKTALILNAVNPRIGGVLIRGEKGTAKSTTVRALADLLPGTPMVTLPLNATEDRVAGGIDFSLAVRTGARAMQQGLLARAHNGFLYVDEVNLLDDHIVDIILDAAASGTNRIEREGISFCHAAQFILVGTMNPEEGELRPQLLDRFGLCVEVSSIHDMEKRILLMEKKEDYDADPEGFSKQYQTDAKSLSDRIIQGKKRLDQVAFPEDLRAFVADLCSRSHVAGHRADLVIEQAASALAAFCGNTRVGMDEVTQVAPFALIHRKRDPMPPPPPPDHDHNQESNKENNPQTETDPPPPPSSENGPDKQPEDAEDIRPPEEIPPEEQAKEPEETDLSEPENACDDSARDKVLEKIFEIGETFRVKPFTAPKDRMLRRGSGKRSRSRTAAKQGRYVRSTLPRGNPDIAFDATLRAAAPYQMQRKNGSGLAVILKDRDIRKKIREKRIGNFLLFVVDASASMGARGRMSASKGAIMSLLLDAYQKRDKVAMVTFRQQEAWVNLPPTTSVELAGKLLAEMPVGGRTPLSAGLVKGYELMKIHLLKEPEARPMAILITDGRGNVPLGNQSPVKESLALAEKMAEEKRIQFIVVDSESQGALTFGLARKLAENLSARYFKIQDLKVNHLVDIAKGGLL
jgi:magnesium chelatase subunit D